MIDLHAHLLPDIDDGPDTVAESVAMAQAAWDAGIHTMVCTPHMIEHFPTDPVRVHESVAQLQAALEQEGVPLRILPGGEIAISHLAALNDDQLRMASYGGSGRWVLLEMPFHGWPIDLPEILHSLEIRGYGAILAHPERAEAVQRQPDRMRDVVGRGALVQLTAGSFVGDHGEAARRTAVMLLAGGAAHILATDAHSPGPWRPPLLDEGVRAAADAIDVAPEALSWMVTDGPAAILEGRPVRPPRIGRALRTTPDPERLAAERSAARAPARRGRPSARPTRR